ncbi:MAG: molybdopterin-synthase adenylyltransferase MoeB [Actinobacteria bacterium]|nr:molybdopterin-synthase adenylyltransferase MoeB [Actinomycetota bacterium]
MATPRELLAEARRRVREVTPEGAAELIASGANLLDVREGEEVAQGVIPNAVHVPRGHLEFQVEGRLPVKDQPLVVYCAGGVRSAFAAATLEALGYADVVSMEGGFGRWKDEGRPWTTPRRLGPEQLERYARHLLLPEVGSDGQAKLLDSRVLLLGAGGLGSPAALYLAAAGVGTIGIIDMDVVDRSNLQRQILHADDRVGDRKVDSAKKTLTALNPDVDVVAYDLRLGADNVMGILDEGNWQVIVDGTDNFATRYLLSDACVLLDLPYVYGSIFRFDGQVSVFGGRDGPCYRCLFREPPPPGLVPSCAEGGVLGVLPGIIGSLQAMEALKLLLGIGDPLSGRLIAYDALEGSFRELRVPRDPACPTCGPDAPPIELRDDDYDCG